MYRSQFHEITVKVTINAVAAFPASLSAPQCGPYSHALAQGQLTILKFVRLRDITHEFSRLSIDLSIVSPEQYAAAIRHHADQTTETSLFPGHGFENLANYLQRTNSGSTVAPSQADKDFTFVKLLVLGPTLEPNEHCDFSEPPDLSSKSFGDLSRTQLLFLRGKPTATWLNTLGARYMIDPSFFQRHLSFWSTVGRLEYFATQSLPSMQQNIFSLRYITLGHTKRPLHGKLKSSLVTERKSSAKAMQKYWEAMYKAFDQDSDLGTSIIRDVQVHDQSHFSLEQQISVTLKKNGANAWQRMLVPIIQDTVLS